MKYFVYFFPCLFLFSQVNAQSIQMTFEELYLAGESDMSLEAQAEQLAISQQRPICIYLENQVLIEAKGIEDDQPIYMVITNFNAFIINIIN